jgi:ADP-heptose:LPS heptosyltransferase
MTQASAGQSNLKILLVSLAGIGDTLLATPLLRALREQLPQAQIDALVMWAGSRDLLEGNPHVNTVHYRHLLRESHVQNLRFLWGVRRQGYDLSINTYPQGKIQYRITARLINARRRLSHYYENRHLWDDWLVTDAIEQDYHVHCIENNLNFLPLLGLKKNPPSRKGAPAPAPEPLALGLHRNPPFRKGASGPDSQLSTLNSQLPLDCEIYFPAGELTWAEEFARAHKLAQKQVLGLHVGSGKTKNLIHKRWPLDHYLALGRALLAAYPELVILLFGGPDEQSENEALLQQWQSNRVLRVTSRTIKQGVAVLGHCQVFLSVDNVFMHLAAAMKVPRQIVIESPTFNKTIEPYHRPFRLVRNPLVAGRNLDYYRYDGRNIQGGREHLLACMRSITPAMALEAVREALD